MADYRSVQTRMWREDEWFDSLDTEARLFWIYLFTNPSSSPAGIFRLTMRTMSNESGISFERALDLMERFATDKKAYYNGGVVWVVNMRRLQFPDLDGSGAWQVATRMQADIDMIPDTNPLKGEYLRRNGYPIITPEVIKGKEVKRVSIQYGYPIDTQSVNSNITVTETETSTSTKPNGRSAEDALIDPDIAKAIAKWREVFAGTPNEGNPPVSQITKWLAYYGPDVLCHMIGKAADKQNPAGWMYTTYDNWRKDGEVAPYVLKEVENARIAAAPIVTKTVRVDFGDGTFEDREVQTRGT